MCMKALGVFFSHGDIIVSASAQFAEPYSKDKFVI